jgi:RNA polymerase sigma factor (sigma-70 family)
MDSNDKTGSISQLLNEFKARNSEATDELIRRYWDRVLAAASARLHDANIRVVDGEDVAVSVFASLCRRAEEERFDSQDLGDRDDLWRLLSRLIRNKAIDAVRRDRAKKRGSGDVRGDSVFMNVAGDSDVGWGAVGGLSETPLERAILVEQQARLLEALKTDVVREIVMLRLEGYEIAEIAKRVGLSDRSVKRKIALAREAWIDLDGSADDK